MKQQLKNSEATFMAGVFPESHVVKIWQDCLPGRTDLVTEEDGPIEVVYPGRLNDDRGADLRDAVIATGRGLRKGDVEIHVRSSSWWGHRHHQDPLYNRVILHVVYWHDLARVVTLQNGRKVPTLALEKYITETPGRDTGPVYPLSRQSMPCRETIKHRDQGFIDGILETAGDRRFDAKVAEFRVALSQVGAGQSLYQGIMGALGYVKNKVPMIELARRVPLSRLAAAPGELPDDECLAGYQALLLGMAGLLYVKDDLVDAWIGRLEKTWAAYGETATMSGSEWNSFKVRPGNLPRRRIAAMSYLLLRYRDKGLLAGLVDEFKKASSETGRGGLERLLLVSAEGYWKANMDFGSPAGRIVPALLGEGRAGVIVVNVLLPFAAAWGRAASCREPAEKASEIYRRYPGLAENTLEKHMRRQLGISRCLVNSARRQQGLIHVYKTLCSQGKCLECPLGG
jgi:hypothetical protein